MKEGIMTGRKERLRKKAERRKQVRDRILRYADDILQSENFLGTRKDIQHGTVSVYGHCISVAECSLEIMERLEGLGIQVQERELVRGALLHDYFLYDWHTHKGAKGLRNLHGFRHPGVALENAGKEYALTPRERDIIVKHMWPMTVVPPLCREAWIVTAADKYCSLLETLRLRRERKRPLSVPLYRRTAGALPVVRPVLCREEVRR